MGKKKPGHYCKICGEYKADEKFTGKDHAAHICKACAGLSASEKAEKQTINRLLNLHMDRLSANEKIWLENRVHDHRPAVAALAKEIYNFRSPYAERNARKKQLYIKFLEFEVHTDMFDEWGDELPVHQCFTADRASHVLTMADLGSGTEQSVTLEGKKMAALLRWVVHSLEVFMWGEDYGLSLDPDEEMPVSPNWQVKVEYTDHTSQHVVSCQGYLESRPEELYFALLEYFESEENFEKDSP